MDQLFQSIIEAVSERFPISPVDLDPELAEPKSFLKVLNARHYNWKAERFRKLFGMRFEVKIPALDQLNTIFYPQPVFDTPIFIFFCLLTKRKVIAHLNVNCPFDDQDYRSRYIDPLVALQHKYPTFACADRYPEWMKKYRNECTIYGMFTKDRLADLTACTFDYLEHYLGMAVAAQCVEDTDRLDQIARFHQQFVADIRTQDKAQGMIAKMIGKEKAKRIFYEITT